MFRELCMWEVGVRLGWLPMTRRYLKLPISPIDALANFHDIFTRVLIHS
jgi:hypothetical protein